MGKLFANNWDQYVTKPPNAILKPLPCLQSEDAIRDVLNQMADVTDNLAMTVYAGYKAETASVFTGIHPDMPHKIPVVSSSAEDSTIHFSIYPAPGKVKYHVYVSGPVDGKYTYVKTTRPG